MNWPVVAVSRRRGRQVWPLPALCRPDPQLVFPAHLQFRRNGIRQSKPHLQGFAAEQIGVLGQRLQGMGAEGVVHRHGPRRAHPKPGQPGNHLPGAEHFLEFLADAQSLFSADPFDVRQPPGFLGDHIQGLFPKAGHQLFGCGRPDIGQSPRREIGQDVLHRLGHTGLAGHRPELFPISRVALKTAVGHHALADTHLAHHAGHLVVLAAAFHLKHGIAGIFIFKDHMDHPAFQPACPLGIFHPAPPPVHVYDRKILLCKKHTNQMSEHPDSCVL